MPKGKSSRGLADKRRGLAYKLARRDALNIQHGQQPGWARDGLDLYLDGYSIADVAGMMGMSAPAVGAAIAKEALYRLMAAKQADRLEEMELGKGDPSYGKA